MRPWCAVILGMGIALAGAAAAQPVQPVEGVWHLTGRVTATGCADHCVTRRQRVDQEVVVTSAQLSGAEALVPGCSGGVSADEFDGLAMLVPGRRGWLRIRIVDRPRFRRLLRRCIGYPSLRLGKVSGRVRLAPDGRTFDEVVFVSGSVVVYGRTATFSARGRIHAQWVRDAAPLGSPHGAFLSRVLDDALQGE
jgi:hypothetical protein